MNLLKRIWYFFFPKPVPAKPFWDKQLVDQFSTKTAVPPLLSTKKVQIKRPVPRVAAPPPPPPMKKYYPHDAIEAERRIRNEMREETERRRAEDASDALIGLGVGLAIGALLDNDNDSFSSFSDVSSSIDTTESWSGGGGESGGGGSSGEW
jgi:uncharacterized membrane protein YgcG